MPGLPEGSGADYVAVVLRSNLPLWQPGEIKAEIRSTASPDIYTCTYFMANKKPGGTTLTLDHDSLLRGSIATPKGPFDLMLMRVWPEIAKESASATSAKGGASGTGFLISRNGLLATNWHVVADAKNISVAFPGWNGSAKAEVVIRDVVNDLAVLRVTDPAKLTPTCPEVPFQLTSSNGVKLGGAGIHHWVSSDLYAWLKSKVLRRSDIKQEWLAGRPPLIANLGSGAARI